MLELLSSPEVWISFATLTALEIVLGIDNIVFLSILVAKLPVEQQQKGRLIGLGLAMFMRVALLLSITWVMGLTADLFAVFGQGISGRDLILLGGGGFLMAKATLEIHESLEGGGHEPTAGKTAVSFLGIVAQIALIDIVFSLDSVITAVGLSDHIEVMVAAVVVAVLVMMLTSKAIGDFVDNHPTVKMLALSFLILVGVVLVGEGLGLHVPKGYIYFAMAFSVMVEMLNLKIRGKRQPLVLHKHPPA